MLSQRNYILIMAAPLTMQTVWPLTSTNPGATCKILTKVKALISILGNRS